MVEKDLYVYEKFIRNIVESWINKQGYIKRTTGMVTAYDSGSKIAQVKIAGGTTSVSIKNLTGITLVANDLVYVDINNNNMTDSFISFKR